MRKQPEYNRVFNPLARLDDASRQEVEAAIAHIGDDKDVEAIMELLSDEAASAYESVLKEQEVLNGKLPALVQYLSKLNPAHAENNIPLFSHDIFGQFINRIQRSKQVQGTAKAIYGIIEETAALRDDVDMQEIASGIYKTNRKNPTIESSLEELKLNTLNGRRQVIKTLGERAEDVRRQIISNREDMIDEGLTVRWKNNFGHSISLKAIKDQDSGDISYIYTKSSSDEVNAKFGTEKTQYTIDETGNMVKVEPGQSVSSKRLTQEEAKELLEASDGDVLNSFVIPKQHAMDMTRMMKSIKLPDEQNAVLKALDKFQNLWKAMHTGVLPFLSFHARNRGSGGFANFTTEAKHGDPRKAWYDPMRYFQPSIDARNLQRNRVIDGIDQMPAIKDDVAGMTPQEQTEYLRGLAYIHELTGGKQGLAAEQLGDSVDSLKNQVPGALPMWSELPPESSFFTRWFDPTAMRGVRTDDTEWAPAIYGSDLSRYVEGQNRLSPWISLLRQVTHQNKPQTS